MPIKPEFPAMNVYVGPTAFAHSQPQIEAYGQAMFAYAIELAVQVCDAQHLESPTKMADDIAYDLAVRHCADAIRALLNKEAT